MKIIGFKWYRMSLVCKHMWEINQNYYTSIFNNGIKKVKNKGEKQEKNVGYLEYIANRVQQSAGISK